MSKRGVSFRNWIRDLAGAPHHLPVKCEPGSHAPQEAGSGYYWTTPSGKTVVRYPNAYHWPKAYHASTARVSVGKEWGADAIASVVLDAVGHGVAQ